MSAVLVRAETTPLTHSVRLTVCVTQREGRERGRERESERHTHTHTHTHTHSLQVAGHRERHTARPLQFQEMNGFVHVHSKQHVYMNASITERPRGYERLRDRYSFRKTHSVRLTVCVCVCVCVCVPMRSMMLLRTAYSSLKRVRADTRTERQTACVSVADLQARGAERATQREGRERGRERERQRHGNDSFKLIVYVLVP